MKKLLVFVLLAAHFSVHGQSILDSKLDGSEQGQLLTDFLHSFEKDKKVRFFFINDWFDQIRIQNSYKDRTLRQALEGTLQGTDISFIEFHEYAVIFSKDPARALERESIIRNARNEQVKIDNIILGNKANYQSGKMVQISGVVTDGKSREAIGGASISFTDINRTTTTAPDGRYSIAIPAGEHVISCKAPNFDEKIINLMAFEAGVINMEMADAPKMLSEVEVNADHLNVVNSRIGQTNIKMADVKKMPSFLGEVDIIKSIQILPGVTSVGEVSSGFNVRGGGVDQNLVLYDGMQVFNNAHVFGFFSTFNAEAIKDANFFKGGIPAEYGGRVSSVLNVTSKEGNYKKWESSGGIGLVSSSLAVGGPLKKDVSSVLLSVRSSYSDWMLKSLGTNYQNIQNSSVSFYDVSLKLTHKFGANDKLSYSGYVSKDHFGLPSDTTFVWQNLINSVHYDHIFSERSFSTVTAGYGQYSYQVSDADPSTSYQMRYKISYPSFKVDFNTQLGRHKLMYGLNSIFYKIAPGSIRPESIASSVKPLTLSSEQSFANALFLSDDFDVTERFHVDAGFRFSMFSSLGPAKVYQYQPGEPLSNTTIIDSTRYSSGKIIKNYFGPEPRLSLRYNVAPNSSIKIGYNRIYQYIHLISSSTAITPVDIWQPSNYFFKPQRGDQVSIGFFQNLNDAKYELSVEGFYKYTKNILDFKDGATLILNPVLETALLQGVAKSYGVEFSAAKTAGRLVGSLNYTYARSLRRVTGQFPEENINHGNWYRSNYDQPHVINLNWKYGVSRRFAFTGNFTYRTGRPVTVPISYAVVDNIPIVNFSDRNSYRVPDYHRLDLALVMEGNHRRKKFWDGTWTLSLYNVYARKNVYSVFYKKNDIGLETAYRMSIVGTILPSLSYKFKF